MPPVFVAIGEYVVGFLFAAGVSAGAAVAVGAFVTSALIYSSEAFIFSKILQALSPKAPKGSTAANRGMQVTISDTGAGGYAIYGNVKCGGVNVIPPITGGNNGEFLEQIIAYCLHQVSGFGPMWADDVAFDQSFDIQVISGSVSDGECIGLQKYATFLWMRQYNGSATDPVDWIINNRYPTVFTSAFRGRGVAKSYFTYAWDDGKIWNGIPVMQAEILGNAVYDPRLDSTNGGTGSQSRSDPSTWTWFGATNPALCWAHYSMALYGGNVGTTGVNWASVIAAANVCDGIVPVPTGVSTFVNEANMTITGTTFTKTGGTNRAWDSAVKSTDGTINGYVTAMVNNIADMIMFGFSRNPSASASYVTIDYALFYDGDTQSLLIYESAANQSYVVAYLGGSFGFDPTGMILKVDYDGTYMRYYINDTCIRITPVSTPGSTYFFDSSFYTAGASLTVGVQRRYTCNGRITLTNDWRDNAKLFIDAMLGRMIRTGSIFSCYAGAWTIPTFNVNKEDWSSIDSIKTVQPRDSGRYNDVHIWIVNMRKNWQRVETFPRTSALYASADGSESIPLEIEQPLCLDDYEGQRKGEFVLRRSRNGIVLSGTLPPRFRKILTGDVGAFTFAEIGWFDKEMRVITSELGPDGSIKIGISEEQAEDWDDLLETDYDMPSHSPIPATNPTTPTAPGSFGVVPNINGTLTFSLTDPVVKPIGTRFQVIRSGNASDASVGTAIYDGVLSQVDLICPASVQYYYARAYVGSHYSGYIPNTFGVSATANGFNAAQVGSQAITMVHMVNCISTQVFSGAGALHAGVVATDNFIPQLDDSDVLVTAHYRQGLGNINGTQVVKIQFLTGVTSVFDSSQQVPTGGSAAAMQPASVQGQFKYTKGNSVQVNLFWSASSGTNSCTFDQVSLLTEFVKK